VSRASEAPEDPLVGTTIARYRLTRLLGKGGMGRVYLGVHPDIGSRVAIKVLSDDCADSPELVERFFAEARSVNLIRHENIINVLDLDRLPSGRPYIVMEYVDGRTLRDVAQLGAAPLGGIVHATIEVLLALEAAHAAGVIHRDLKPDNVMITASGRTKVLDFGIAKLAAPGSVRTQTGAAIGTPPYMAPEQILGEDIDARTDVYAVGVMLFELATGRRPFEGVTDYQIMEGHLRGPIPRARTLRTEIPASLEAVIDGALAKRPHDRFQSARAMARALKHAAAELGSDQWQPLASLWAMQAASVSHDQLPVVTDSGETVPGSGPTDLRVATPVGDPRFPDRTRPVMEPSTGSGPTLPQRGAAPRSPDPSGGRRRSRIGSRAARDPGARLHARGGHRTRSNP
jgi:serine/threonine-protein kinase